MTAARRRSPRQRVRWIAHRLQRTLGPQGWWPGQTPFEVMVGAVLTQAASWRNVESALARLKALGPLTPRALAAMPRRTLERALRPVGFFRVKAARLGQFVRFYLERFGGDVRRARRMGTGPLRQELGRVPGLGWETVDSIVCYAVGRPVFVVDAYTMRILRRHRLVHPSWGYQAVQEFVQGALPLDTAGCNELHARFVRVGKTWCRTRPACTTCPLASDLGAAWAPGTDARVLQ